MHFPVALLTIVGILFWPFRVNRLAEAFRPLCLRRVLPCLGATSNITTGQRITRYRQFCRESRPAISLAGHSLRLTFMATRPASMHEARCHRSFALGETVRFRSLLHTAREKTRMETRCCIGVKTRGVLFKRIPADKKHLFRVPVFSCRKGLRPGRFRADYTRVTRPRQLNTRVRDYSVSKNRGGFSSSAATTAGLSRLDT